MEWSVERSCSVKVPQDEEESERERVGAGREGVDRGSLETRAMGRRGAGGAWACACSCASVCQPWLCARSRWRACRCALALRRGAGFAMRCVHAPSLRAARCTPARLHGPQPTCAGDTLVCPQPSLAAPWPLSAPSLSSLETLTAARRAHRSPAPPDASLRLIRNARCLPPLPLTDIVVCPTSPSSLLYSP